MAVITLTTEWSEYDYYYGVVRGTLASMAPQTAVILNAGSIPPFNTLHAAFVVRNTFHHYPEGSVHLIFVNSEAGYSSRHLLVKARGHYFIGNDNGIFNLIINERPDAVREIKSEKGEDDLRLFARTAAEVIRGSHTDIITSPADDMSIKESVPFRATLDEGAVNGTVIYIDSYGNAITNITRDLFERVFGKKPFTAAVQGSRHHIKSISGKYCDEAAGELLARFNNLDLMEIAINGSSISRLYDLDTGSVVRVTADKSEVPGEGLFS